MDEPRDLAALDDDELLAALGAALAVDSDTGERSAVVVPLTVRPRRRWLAAAAAAVVLAGGAAVAAGLSPGDDRSNVATGSSTTVATAPTSTTPLQLAAARLDALEQALGRPDDAALAAAAAAARDALAGLSEQERAAVARRAGDLLALADARLAPPSTTVTSGVSPTTTTPATTPTTADVSGNCDEPEHFDDPECTTGTTEPDDDNSGPGGGGSGSDD